jgi:hypothetical protein
VETEKSIKPQWTQGTDKAKEGRKEGRKERDWYEE